MGGVVCQALCKSAVKGYLAGAMERILGVEGGGTKTAWIVAEAQENGVIAEKGHGRLPPSNLRLTSPERLRQILAELPREVERVGLFLAGCVTPEDHRQLELLAKSLWPKARVTVGSDRDSGLAAALGTADGIAVNAGTGASVTGRAGTRTEKAGGWGHILGDTGGGYFVGLQALRLILRAYDLHRGEGAFAGRILNALCLNSLDDLVRWAQTADKMEIAALSPTVFEAALAGDLPVQEIIATGARTLAEYTAAVAHRLALKAPAVRWQGGLFERQPFYVEAFSHALRELLPEADVQSAPEPPELGALRLAAAGDEILTGSIAPIRARPPGVESEPGLAESPTESANPRSSELEGMSPREMVDLFVREEAGVAAALHDCREELAEALELIAGALGRGGRLFYVGAGTSGRLGVLDASEIPPTFGTEPDLVQGIIAGGVRALYRSVEGAEDERSGGVLALKERNVGPRDVVCGVTASGRTPFVLGALEFARSIGAGTILLTCRPGGAPVGQAAQIAINLATGPEIVTGSTRLKAGSATKVALNILSTGAMARLGKVRGNMMIDLVPSNTKLRARAIRTVAGLRGCSLDEAAGRLEKAGWKLRAALDDEGSAGSTDSKPGR